MHPRFTVKTLAKSLPWRFFKKQALIQIIVTTLILISSAYIGRYFLKKHAVEQAEQQLVESLRLIEHSILTQNINPVDWCHSLKLNWVTRYTLIDWKGVVLCDNYVDVKNMDNHRFRPEIVLARNTGSGQIARYSKSYATEMVYAAIQLNLKDGERYILREAIPLQKVADNTKSLDRALIFLLFPILLITSLLSLWASFKVSFPLSSLIRKMEKLNINKSEKSHFILGPSDEWVLLERTLDQAQIDIDNYLQEIHLENEKFSAIIESISESIFVISNSHRILFANGNFRKNFLGENIQTSELSQYKIWELTRDFNIQNIMDNVLKSGNILRERNMEIVSQEGEQKLFYDVTVSPLKNIEGHIQGAICILYDVTERTLAEQMREDFVANVSHEVRTPLTAMKGYAQILKSALKEAPQIQIDHLQKIETNSDRLTALFNDVLNLSVIESKNKIAKSEISTEDITKSIITNVKQSHLSKNLKIETFYNAKTVLADPLLLEQVLSNLIDNAFKYTLENGTVRVYWEEKEFYTILKVKDTGVGIPKEHHIRLFERFYRVDPSRSREMGGTGLGLSIVKHIMQKHQGKISVESEENVGTSFFAYFPKSKV